jgi:hypothetical protein
VSIKCPTSVVLPAPTSPVMTIETRIRRQLERTATQAIVIVVHITALAIGIATDAFQN